MIKPNVIIILLVVCVMMAAGFFLVQGDRPQVSVASAGGEKLIKNFNSDSVNTIEIKKGDVAIKLEKKDKNWLLASHKNRAAKSDRVETLLTNIKSAALERTRTGKPELFALDEKARIELTLSGEASKNTVYVGKSPDWSKSFVSTESNGPVYEVDKGLDTDAGIRTEKDERILDAAYFYDLKIFGFSADDIIDISIKKDGAVTRVQKVIPGKNEPVQPKQEPGKDDPKPIWWLTEPEGAAADEGAVSSVTSTLSSLNAKSYADTVAEKDRGLDKPAAKVKLRLKDGTEHDLSFGKMDGDDVIVAVSGKSDPYKVYKYVFENVTKELKKKDEEKKADADESALPPDISKLAPPKLEEKPAVKKNIPTPPPPPAPPSKVEPEAKPTLPPAVVKPDEKAKKIDEKK